MSFRFHNRRLIVSAVVFLLVFVTSLAWLWFTTPADPVYKEMRLSRLLYVSYGNKGPWKDRVHARGQCENALRDLGPKASPLLTAWIENRPSRLREKLRDFLIRKKIDWPYLTADRQAIVEGLFFSIPAAAVPVAEAFQWQILNGESRDAMRAASLLMFVINSVDRTSRELIASRSQGFAVGLLDQFEANGEDRYALVLIGPLLANSPESERLKHRDRVLTLSKRSRYLDAAVQRMNAPEGRRAIGLAPAATE